MKCYLCNNEKSYWDLYLIPFTHKGFNDVEYSFKKLCCPKCMNWPLDKNNRVKFI